MELNPLLCTDFYKVDHRRQYPTGTQFVFSNLTARSGKNSNVPSDGHVVFVGLSAVLAEMNEMWNKGFFSLSEDDAVQRYRDIIEPAVGPLKDYEHIRSLHRLGYLPLTIRALPEGSLVPYGVPMLTIVNTHPDHFWLTNYVETYLSSMLWKPITSATTAYAYRKLIDSYLAETSDNPFFAWFQGHDFSARGMSGPHDATMSGIGHLASFIGTDTISAIHAVLTYYGKGTASLVGASVAATEHSVMCAGAKDSEIETIRRLITEIYPSGIVSIVSDTWDFWKVINEYAPALREEILNRDGKVVFRPDSGDPVKIICGDPNATPGSCEFLGAVRILDKHFGTTTNSKGYKVLNSKVGLIYGDSITYERAKAILQNLKSMGYSTENIVFGIGSYTYQNVTRDTHGFAIKATWAQINGEHRELFKDPVTDNGVKKSHRGLLRVDRINDKYVVIDKLTREDYFSNGGCLDCVMQNAEMVRRAPTISEIRDRLHTQNK